MSSVVDTTVEYDDSTVVEQFYDSATRFTRGVLDDATIRVDTDDAGIFVHVNGSIGKVDGYEITAVAHGKSKTVVRYEEKR